MRSAARVLTRRSFIALSAIAVAGAPMSAAGAPEASGAWRVQPTAGLWAFAVYAESDGLEVNRLGQFAGLELSRQLGARTRLTASTGYYRIGDAVEVSTTAQGQPRTEVYDYHLVPLSAGLAYDVWQGGGAARPAAVSLGLEAGAFWDSQRLVRSTGPDTFTGEPSLGSSGFGGLRSSTVLAAPALAVRRAVARQAEVTAGVRSLIVVDSPISAWWNPTFSAGLAWRL